MKKIVHRAESRGHANHGWLDSHHTFSFAGYYDPERIHFGALRVLNDDTVAAGRGFGAHPHQNMEIVSIPLEGDLEHRDSMGNVAIIRKGDIQVMSAGTGVQHSEMNRTKNGEVKFLQIWIFPNTENVEPRYDQISLESVRKENELFQILSPDANDAGVWIHQNAWFNWGELKSDTNHTYKLHNAGNGVYVFVLSGKISTSNETLTTRDAIGIWETDEIEFSVEDDSVVLVMEVPMENY
ncbi:MAG: pirin family protein [Bacteroidetes bacterium]|nr:pirin family protein [Bacteroidota bacterium]